MGMPVIKIGSIIATVSNIAISLLFIFVYASKFFIFLLLIDTVGYFCGFAGFGVCGLLRGFWSLRFVAGVLVFAVLAGDRGRSPLHLVL